MHFANHVLPEEFAPLLESLAQCFVSAAVQRGIAHRTQARAATGEAEFQTNAAFEAEREAARLCVIASSFAAAARGAISGMAGTCQPFMVVKASMQMEANA
jgi:hypothetical protein